MEDLLLHGVRFTNQTHEVLFYTVIALSLFSIAHPWRPQCTLSRCLLHLPLAALFLYCHYETLWVRTSELIRNDLPILLPCMGLALGAYLAKLLILRARRSRAAAGLGA